jgi:hypothetical protein
MLADAFMTGASFAALLPLVAGKIAADPTHDFAVAHSEALQRAVEAAQATPGQPAATPTPYHPTIKGLTPQPALQQTQAAAATPEATAQPNGNVPQQQQDPQQQITPANMQQQQQQQAPGLLSYVSGVVGRLNLTFSDMAYAALWGEDPIPERPHTFHLSGLQQGYRLDDIWRLMRKQGLGRVSGTPLLRVLDLMRGALCLPTGCTDVGFSFSFCCAANLARRMVYCGLRAVNAPLAWCSSVSFCGWYGR